MTSPAMPEEDSSLRRGRPGYGALHSSPSLLTASSSSVRSRSVHLSPDRITRNTPLRADTTDIVPRISQPYRTSFSAVTTPRRIHWSTDNVLDSDSSPRDMRAEYVTKSEDLLSQSGLADSPEQFHPSRGAVSTDSMLSSDTPDDYNHSNGSTRFQRLSTRYASTPGRINGPKQSTPMTNGDRGPLTADSVVSDTVFTESMNKAAELVREFMGTSSPTLNSVHIKYDTKQTIASPPLVRRSQLEDTVKIKTMITKEYVHVATVDYLKGLDQKYRDNLPAADSETNLMILDMLREKGLLANDSPAIQPSVQPKIRQSRALTMSTDDRHKTPSPSPLRRSLSTSISSFLKRMSPKSLRRSFRVKGRSTNHSSGNSSSGSPSAAGVSRGVTDTSMRIDEITHQLKRLTLAHNDSAGSGNQSGSSGAASPSTLPSSSARIMRSMQAPASQPELTVYQSFKAKQSPHVRSTEAIGLKPQALRAVEFQDNLADTPPSSHPTLHPSLISPDGHTATRPPPSNRKAAPRSLDVRQVSKLDKNVFQFPHLSMESIGQCSLDVASTHNGSEPSLATNGLKPGGTNSVSASKRTLVSQENISPTSGGTPLRSDSTDTSHSGPEGSPKTPSYLKLSCAVSGYSPYNSYNSTPRLIPRANGDKAENSIDSSLDQENIIPNGDVGDHGSKVHKVKVAPAKDKSTVVNTTANSTHLTNGAILSNSAVVCGVELSDMPTRTSAVAVLHDSATDSGLDSPDSSRPVRHSHQLMPDQVISTPTNDKLTNDKVLTPQKNGRYFYRIIDQETELLRVLCQHAERDLNSGLVPDEVSGKLRAAIGKGTLLMTKKFTQFRGLCDKNLEQSADEPFQTTCQDLAGFWDMVLLQVEEISDMFADIDRLRRSGWKGHTLSNSRLYAVNTPKSKPGAVRVKSAKSKPASIVSPSTPKSAKSSEAAKQRDEARRRLIAAKRAGRQRKESQTDTVEIFVPQ